MRAHLRLVLVSVLLILLLTTAVPSMAGVNRWTPTGPDAGSVRALAAAPSRPTTLYAVAGNDRVYRSTDRGTTWTLAGAVPESGFQGLRDIAVDPGSPLRVYALGFQEVYRSTDGGASWRPILPDFEAGPEALVVHPRIRGLVYVVSQVGLLRSMDGGRHWTVSGNPAVAGVLAVDPSSAKVLYFGSFLGELFKSVDGGATWSPSSRGLSLNAAIQALAVDPASPRTLYLVPASDGPGRDVFVSRDGGASWSAIPSDLAGGNVRDLAVEPGQRPALYLTVNGRPFRSLDGGRTWREAPLSVPVQDLLATPYGLLAGTAAGIYRSTDRGTSWVNSSRGLQAVSVRSLALDPVRGPGGQLYVVGDGFLFRSADDGASWSLMETPLPADGPLAVAPTRPGSLFVGTSGTVLRSVNTGRGWAVGEQIECALPVSLAVDPNRDWVVYLGIDLFEVPCGDGCRTFKSIDTGHHWTCIANGLPNGGSGLVVADPRRSGVLYATSIGRLYRSDDDGLSWSLLVVGLDPLALAISPADPQVMYAGVANGVGRSDDGGRTWRFDTQGLPEDLVFALTADPADPRTVYTATSRRGVFKSTDGGATWTRLGQVLEGSVVTALALDPRDRATLYAGTLLDGVWKLTQE